MEKCKNRCESLRDCKKSLRIGLPRQKYPLSHFGTFMRRTTLSIIIIITVVNICSGPLGDLLGNLWGLLGTSWGVLEASWAPLGASWGVLGRLGGVLGASWRVLGASWAHLGASWERLGTSWPPSSLQDRKKLEKPTKNHQKPPQHKPDLIWNGKRRFLFGCLLFQFVPVSFPFRFLCRSRFVPQNVVFMPK